jgi:hypothetical protein
LSSPENRSEGVNLIQDGTHSGKKGTGKKGKRGRIYFAHFHGLNDLSWPIVLKKSVLAGAAFPELKKRTTWALLCEKQGNSVSSTVQIST